MNCETGGCENIWQIDLADVFLDLWFRNYLSLETDLQAIGNRKNG